MRAAFDKIETRKIRMETVQHSFSEKHFQGKHFPGKSLQRKAAVSFGCPVMEPYLIPVIHNSTPSCINVPFMAEGQAFNVTSFSLKSGAEARPYGAVIMDNVDDLDIALYGKALSAHPLFPLGADIVFVEVKSKGLLKARLYEKGHGESGFTESGACAAFVAARILQKTESSALVTMDNKTCSVEWDGVDGDVWSTD